MPFFSGINDVVADVLTDAAAANAQAAATTAAPAFTAPAGILRIDPGQVDAAINVFQGAVDKLENRVRLAMDDIRAEAMAADRVSRPAAVAFNNASLAEPAAAIEAWVGAVKEMRSIIRHLEAAREANVRADDIVALPFAAASGTTS